MDRPDHAVLEAIDERSLLSASNCMEILLFSLGTGETFGINVFKVREVCRTPLITRTPNMPAGVEGLISLRGNVIPVLSLAKIMGLARPGDPRGNAMMVTEYSKRILGFLVQDVDRIIRVQWDKVRTPENVSSAVHNFITALSEQPDGKLVSILDVETILANTFGEGVVRSNIAPLGVDHEVNVFYVDDSAVARRKITEVLDKLGVRHKHAQNGLEAWTRLESMARHASHSGRPLQDDVNLILTDAEMPEMDGYVLTRNIKADKRFEGIPVVMHSSLSSEANRAMGKRAGVDAYVAKFDAEALADTLRPLLLRGH